MGKSVFEVYCTMLSIIEHQIFFWGESIFMINAKKIFVYTGDEHKSQP